MPTNPTNPYNTGSDMDWLRQQSLYPMGDPSTAFSNALQDIGVNPFRSNPFISQLQKAAQGSRIAFLADTNGYGGVGNTGNPSERYGAFLRNNLAGGSMMQRLQSTAGDFGNLINRVKQFEGGLGQGNTNVNPYMAALRDIFASDDGMGALSAYTSLRTPGLGGLANAYSRGVQAAGLGAMRNFYRQGTLNSSPWDWLFPSGGSPMVF